MIARSARIHSSRVVDAMPIRFSGSMPSASSPAARASTRSAACFQLTEVQPSLPGYRKASLSGDASTRFKNSIARLGALVDVGVALVWLIGLPFVLSVTAHHLCMATRVRRARDRHGLILLGVPTPGWPKREFCRPFGIGRLPKTDRRLPTTRSGSSVVALPVL